MRNLLAALVLVSLLISLVACGGAGIYPEGGGTPPVAPAITTQPQSKTVTAPQTATFSAVASGSAPISYQWKKNGTAISGANSSSYTTPATTTADSGASFTVIVTNSAGNIISSAAILTVNAASLTPQTITFANPGMQTVGTPLTLSATASSGLAVSFASTTTSVCTVSGTTATFLNAGTCTIQATQAGNSTYAAATPVAQSFTVNAAPVTIPPVPTGLIATAGDARVTLIWSASTGATSYNVKRAATSGGPYTTVVSPTGTSYIDTGLTNGTPYYYVVSAVNTAGESANSSQASATPTAPATTLDPPTNLRAVAGTAEIDLTWNASSGATSYYVMRSTTSGGPYTQLTAVTSTSYADLGLVSGTTYYYAVVAVNFQAESGNSNEASAVFTASHVSQDPGGWTTVTPSADSRLIYVSSSTGNDSTGNGSQAKPYASIDKAVTMIRTGYPDWILLKCGDVFHGQFGTLSAGGGRSADEPMVFTSYGTGARPQIQPDGSDNGIGHNSGASGSPHIYIIGLDFYDARKDPSSSAYLSANGVATASNVVGIRFIDSGNDLLIEDCSFRFLALGVIVQYNGQFYSQNVRIRRNVFADQYATAGFSQGMFLANITGLLIEENIFDHNAWNDQAGFPATVFNHHMYIVDSYNTTIRGNLMLRDSSLSLKLCSYAGTTNAFTGALLENNLIFEGEVGISLGYGASATLNGTAYKGITVRNNVLLQVNRDNPTGRGLGWGIDINSTSESSFTGNIFTDFSFTGNSYAFDVDGGKSTDVNSGITIQNNLIYRVSSDALILVTEPLFSNIKILNNTIQDPDLSSQMIDVQGAFTPFSFSGNTYYDGATTRFAQVGTGGTYLNYGQWVTQSGETGSNYQQITYPDPGRNLETYEQSLTGNASLDEIYAAFRAQSKANWNPAYTAAAVNNYIRVGFGLPPQ